MDIIIISILGGIASLVIAGIFIYFVSKKERHRESDKHTGTKPKEERSEWCKWY